VRLPPSDEASLYLVGVCVNRIGKEQRTEFRLDKRPILSLAEAVGHVDGPEYNRMPQHVTWSYTIKNYGAGSALDVRICDYLRVGGSQFITPHTQFLESEETIVPGRSLWKTAIFPEPMSVAAAKSLMNQETSVILKLVLIYKDALGIRYTDKICLSKLLSGPISTDPRSEIPNIYITQNNSQCEATYK
jgi:hypothetical protein